MAIYDKSLSAQHISANLASYEAARSGFFTLIVDDIDNIVRATYSGEKDAAKAADKIMHAQEYLKLNVVKCDIPHFSTQTLRYRRGNEEVKFAGVPTFDSGSMVIDDVVGLETKDIAMAWQNLTYNVHTRRGGRMVDYKKNCTLVEYTQDYQQIRKWKIYGAFPSKVSEQQFDKENDGKRQLTMTIEYDRAEMLDI